MLLQDSLFNGSPNPVSTSGPEPVPEAFGCNRTESVGAQPVESLPEKQEVALLTAADLVPGSILSVVEGENVWKKNSVTPVSRGGYYSNKEGCMLMCTIEGGLDRKPGNHKFDKKIICEVALPDSRKGRINLWCCAYVEPHWNQHDNLVLISRGEKETFVRPCCTIHPLLHDDLIHLCRLFWRRYAWYDIAIVDLIISDWC